jgi:ABC-2 type transport system ATP-binding protein
VLDEAWTGLDQAARATLDASVCERLADGCSVMFVDHQLSRLTAQLSQRWQFDAGRVKAVAGAGEAGAGGGAAGHLAGDPAATVLIEVSGLGEEFVPQVSAVAGVRSAAQVAGSRRLRVSTTAAECDAVLRQLLGLDGVHVESVRPESGPSEAGPSEAAPPEAGTARTADGR